MASNNPFGVCWVTLITGVMLDDLLRQHCEGRHSLLLGFLGRRIATEDDFRPPPLSDAPRLIESDVSISADGALALLTIFICIPKDENIPSAGSAFTNEAWNRGVPEIRALLARLTPGGEEE